MTTAYGFILPQNGVSQPELRRFAKLSPNRRLLRAVREMLGHDAHENVIHRDMGTVSIKNDNFPLSVIVAIHNSLLSLPYYLDDGQGTQVRPVLGGNRIFPYAELGDASTLISDEPVGVVSAFRDAKELSRGMTYKWAALNLMLIHRAFSGESVTEAELLASRMGGGKSVNYVDGLADLVKDDNSLMSLLCPIGDRSHEDISAFERRIHEANAQLVSELGGRYIFAPDMNTDNAVMEFVRLQLVNRSSPILPVACLPRKINGSGDPSLVTAEGVYYGMRAGAEFIWGDPNLTDRIIGFSGVGKVGYRHLERILEDNCRFKAIHVADIDTDKLDRINLLMDRYGKRLNLDYFLYNVNDESTEQDFYKIRFDIFCPTAAGQVLTEERTKILAENGCKVIAGGANNQRHPLESEAVDSILVNNGIAYAPDYIINLGGILNVLYERDDVKSGNRGHINMKRPIRTVRGVKSLLLYIFEESRRLKKPTQRVADAMVEEHLARYAMISRYGPADLVNHRYTKP